jgi:hypothetical protein
MIFKQVSEAQVGENKALERVTVMLSAESNLKSVTVLVEYITLRVEFESMLNKGQAAVRKDVPATQDVSVLYTENTWDEGRSDRLKGNARKKSKSDRDEFRNKLRNSEDDPKKLVTKVLQRCTYCTGRINSGELKKEIDSTNHVLDKCIFKDRDATKQGKSVTVNHVVKSPPPQQRSETRGVYGEELSLSLERSGVRRRTKYSLPHLC